MAPRRVAACVVTGFLGSGKTTLLKGLLERDPGRERIAVIVNELGEIGIDGRVLTGFEFVENVVEMASGCVCCSIDEYRFDLAVDELVRRIDPVLLVLETTGVADPGPAVERLRRSGLGVDAVICVVDARSWQMAWRVSATARRQIEAADFLVITKGDLVTPRAVQKLQARLATLQPRALVLEAVHGRPFPGAELLLATSAARADDRARAATSPAGSEHLAGEGIESFSWRTPRSVDRSAFEQVMTALPAGVLRAKGLVRCVGERRAWLFQFVCGRFEWTVLDGGDSITEVGVQSVFVGQRIAELRGSLVSRLEACEIADDDGDARPTAVRPGARTPVAG